MRHLRSASACLLIIFLAGCSQWKVVSLKAKSLMFLKNGESVGDVAIRSDEYALDDLSFQVSVAGKRVCVADNNLKRIQVLNRDGEPELIIGSLKGVDTARYANAKFNFNIMGSLTMDTDGRIYVQNRLTQGSAGDSTEGGGFTPSYILVFDARGKLEYTLGQKGTPDMPFYYIDSMDVDENGRLFVISRSFDTWTVFRFSGKKRDYYRNLGEIDFTDRDGSEVFAGKIENVRMFHSGDKLLISVAYYQDMRLKYRKVFAYDINSSSLGKPLLNTPDPRNTLFTIMDDKHLYFWNIDEGEVKFMVTNLQGGVVTNLRLEFDDSRNFYSRVLSDNDGHLYSMHVTRKGMELVEWQ